MKIGISLPDDVFRQVERAAKRLSISRSELLSRAAVEFLAEQRGCDVTASYDRAFGEVDDELEMFRREAARRALLEVEW
ncbi:MAG: ribbon-helix-helix protein, CopG family [Deltaproteobacteria bacterium]|nr:ribbon-helix-helix protein, CopG family [Deltaproteobacteria bacterium]